MIKGMVHTSEKFALIEEPELRANHTVDCLRLLALVLKIGSFKVSYKEDAYTVTY